jgi:DNA-binding transcriptional LysR family regulator
VASYARRLLSINDQIVHIRDAGPRPELVIRVGTPNEYITSLLPGVFAEFRERRRMCASSSATTPTIRWYANCVAAISTSCSDCR